MPERWLRAVEGADSCGQTCCRGQCRDPARHHPATATGGMGRRAPAHSRCHRCHRSARQRGTVRGDGLRGFPRLGPDHGAAVGRGRLAHADSAPHRHRDRIESGRPADRRPGRRSLPHQRKPVRYRGTATAPAHRRRRGDRHRDGAGFLPPRQQGDGRRAGGSDEPRRSRQRRRGARGSGKRRRALRQGQGGAGRRHTRGHHPHDGLRDTGGLAFAHRNRTQGQLYGLRPRGNRHRDERQRDQGR